MAETDLVVETIVAGVLTLDAAVGVVLYVVDFEVLVEVPRSADIVGIVVVGVGR